MINIHLKYKDNPNVKMLLQIHDELIFEVKDEYVDEVIEDIKEIMESIFVLNVPLKVSVGVANSWQDLK
jgi:DNA polymerase-1